MFDFQDKAQRAGGLPHGALARVGDVVAGADAVARSTLGTGVLLAHRTAPPSRTLIPKTLPSLPAFDVFTGPGV